MDIRENLQSKIRNLSINLDNYLKKSISEDNKQKLEEGLHILYDLHSKIDSLKIINNLEIRHSVTEHRFQQYLQKCKKLLSDISINSDNFTKKSMKQTYYDKIFVSFKELKDIVVILQDFINGLEKRKIDDDYSEKMKKIIQIMDNNIEIMKEQGSSINNVYKKVSEDFTKNDEKHDLLKEKNKKITLFGVLFCISIIWMLAGIITFCWINKDLILNVSKFDTFIKPFISSKDVKGLEILKSILQISFLYKIPFFIFCVSPAFIILREAYIQRDIRKRDNLRKENIIKIKQHLSEIVSQADKDQAISILIQDLSNDLKYNKKEKHINSKDLDKLLKLLKEVKGICSTSNTENKDK